MLKMFQVKMASGSGAGIESDQGYELFDPDAKTESRAGVRFMVRPWLRPFQPKKLKLPTMQPTF